MKKKPTEKSKLPKADPKLLEKVNQAQLALETYFKKNKLDPSKDWTKDKKHGSKVRELVAAINSVREKIKKTTPDEIHHKKSEDKPKEKKPKRTAPVKYDYPKVDGREMTSSEKKKYRSQMRSGGAKAENKAKAPAVKAGKEADKTATVKAKATTKVVTSSTKEVAKAKKPVPATKPGKISISGKKPVRKED